MKRTIYIIIGIFVLSYLTKILLTGQTRNFEKEVNVSIIKKETKEEKINRKYREVGYFTVKDDQDKIYTLRVSDNSYLKYQVQNNSSLVIEKDIFDHELYELKEEYDARQISINSPTNIWLGRLFLIILGAVWIALIYYIFSKIKNISRQKG
jgi:phage terminase large subunit